MRDQTCMQYINPRSISMGPHSISTVCFHAKTGSLILGTNQVTPKYFNCACGYGHKFETKIS